MSIRNQANAIRHQIQLDRATKLAKKARFAWAINHYARDFLNLNLFVTVAGVWVSQGSAMLVWIGVVTGVLLIGLKHLAQVVHAETVKELSLFDPEVLRSVPVCPEIHDG